MLKPFKQFSYRYRNYIAAIASALVNAIWQDLAQGSTQFLEPFPSPKMTSEHFKVPVKLMFPSHINLVRVRSVAVMNALDALQPLSQELFEVVSFFTEMRSSVPVTADK